MNPEAAVVPELQSIVAALIDVGAQLSQIVNHMAASSAERVALPGGQEGMLAPAVLHTLLTETLAGQATLPDRPALAVCAGLLREVERVIGEEIILVPHDADPRPRPLPRARRRRRRRR